MEIETQKITKYKRFLQNDLFKVNLMLYVNRLLDICGDGLHGSTPRIRVQQAGIAGHLDEGLDVDSRLPTEQTPNNGGHVEEEGFQRKDERHLFWWNGIGELLYSSWI